MEIENQEIEIQLQSEPFVGGGGAVNSVNGMTGDVVLNAEDVGALPDVTLYAASLLLTIDSSTYVLTGQLKDQNGNNLGTAQVIDLPLESMVVSGSYDDTTKSVILTLNNGQTITFSVADLVSGLQTEITENNKLDSDLVDDTDQTNKFITQAQLDKLDSSLEIESVGNGLSLDVNNKLDITTFIVLTDDDVNYTHPDEPDTSYIALWLLPAGKYVIDEDATIPVLPGLVGGAINDMYYAHQNPIFLSNNSLAPNSEADIHAIQAEEAVKYIVAIDDGEIDERNAYTQPFIGTDGVNPGALGLVPIPEVTDVDKFLKSDGTWAVAGGGGSAITVLTTADYNYPISNPNAVSPGLLNAGFYVTENDSVYIQTTNRKMYNSFKLYYVTPTDFDSSKWCYEFNPRADASGTDTGKIRVWCYNSTTGAVISGNSKSLLDESWIENSLSFTYPGARVLDAYQGKVLKDLIDNLTARVAVLEGN